MMSKHHHRHQQKEKEKSLEIKGNKHFFILLDGLHALLYFVDSIFLLTLKLFKKISINFKVIFLI